MEIQNFKTEKIQEKAKGFKKRIGKRLKEYMEAKGGPFRDKELVLVVRGKKGEWGGGLVGLTYWNALFVDLLWVEDKYRGRGLGRQLMERAESEARQKGCT